MHYVANRVDPRSLDLRAWSRWCAQGKPVPFSLYGDSTTGKAFQPHHKRSYQTDSPLWRESESRASEHIDRMVRIDARLNGGLAPGELGLLLAAEAPSPDRVPMSLESRAEMAGVSTDTLRAIRRKALRLIDCSGTTSFLSHFWHTDSQKTAKDGNKP